jgi:hypothetical protein
VPPPPWRCAVDAVLWWERAGRAGGLVRYRDSPVGPYRELFAAEPVLRGGLPAGRVPFMAVDSEASLAGGRRNWALPKELARFDGEPGEPGRVVATGDGWSVAVTASARGMEVPLPVWLPARCAQVWRDGRVGTFTVRFRGRVRPGVVSVEHRLASELTRSLRPRRHPALLASGQLHVGAPSF